MMRSCVGRLPLRTTGAPLQRLSLWSPTSDRQRLPADSAVKVKAARHGGLIDLPSHCARGGGGDGGGGGGQGSRGTPRTFPIRDAALFLLPCLAAGAPVLMDLSFFFFLRR